MISAATGGACEAASFEWHHRMYGFAVSREMKLALPTVSSRVTEILAHLPPGITIARAFVT